MVIKLDAHKLETQFISTPRPVLVGYFCKDHELSSHLQVLEDIQNFFEPSLDVFFMEAGLFRAFGHCHRIAGTPTYLAFYNGHEQGRFLGKATLDAMIAFVRQTLLPIEKAQAASSGYRCSHV